MDWGRRGRSKYGPKMQRIADLSLRMTAYAVPGELNGLGKTWEK